MAKDKFIELRNQQLSEHAEDELIKQKADKKAKFDYYYLDQLMSVFGMSWDRSVSMLMMLNFNYWGSKPKNNEDD
ncbi:hypothetical protein [Apilactobacillus timberlakei]|uniref:Uncharacterized protein n=1 Tax=Apilactobacillus timberlakei TaxID=2008380 RepID=A0ABY2YRB7_9LACO|nr:hypothetical protein [Apilactobacillus timberlakei]TPR12759.1 hypothetical protein DY048_07045 [Apilactobacillus timberlakei]TPR13642.1 hypothetical protein DY052_07915 [Apilactobacillus timberlakei]